MTSMTRQYSAAAGRARDAAGKTADFWTQGARTVKDLVPGLQQVDLVPAVERYFELVQRTVDINRHLAVRCAEAVGTLSGVAREKAESAGDLVREKAEAAGNVVREQAEKAEQQHWNRPRTLSRPRRSWHVRPARPSGSRPDGLTRGPASATKAWPRPS
jgi:hypothetical protein